MPVQPITVLGECVADAFVQSPDAGRLAAPGELILQVHAGGGPANTAVGLSRLGSPTRFVARLSEDTFGRLFRTHLTASGVDLSFSVRATEPSTLAVAELDRDGRASYSFHAERTADWQWRPEELAAVPLTGTACVHTGSLALIREPGGRAVEDFLDLVHRAPGRPTVSIDPNVRPLLVDPARYRERLDRWCAAADLLRLSAEDLGLLLPGVPPEAACDRWHAAGVRLVVITLGEQGALASLDGTRVTVPAVPVQVVDTVGAGDAFTAGLLHHLGSHGLLGGGLDRLTAQDTAAACAYASRVAALTCAVPGPNPPWAGQLTAGPADDPTGTAPDRPASRPTPRAAVRPHVSPSYDGRTGEAQLTE
ncbi:carbohydrate kinase family protein [Saccharothrix sp. ST-888]|uniref:carbohydrate kinase family protein n=1 Tax=Saccharothrix sp. ST-888 TaxID=1427391 RepID=UPI0007C69D59|nr:carbohydrate kinase [Saccharothrix sp. ST-888]